MATPLTIDNFEIDKLRAKSPETKKGGNITYYSIPFEYKDRKSLSKVEGNFRVFRHENKEEISYSLAMELMMRMRNSLLNWEKGWLNSPMNKRVKFQNHLNHRISNWLRLLRVVNTRTCMLEFTRANLEK